MGEPQVVPTTEKTSLHSAIRHPPSSSSPSPPPSPSPFASLSVRNSNWVRSSMVNVHDPDESCGSIPSLAPESRTRREQERERRRMRDRQRRQSMTLEQKEKHLARRRRNYQLRRERKNQGSDHQSGQTDTAIEHGNTGRNDRQMDHSVSQFTAQYDRADPAGFNQVLQNISAESLRSNGGKSTTGVRLNRLKRLARTANSAPNEASEKNHHDETQGQQKPEVGEVQPNGDKMTKMSSDNVAIEDKNCSDGNHE
ncbi:hypothetical protein EUGRSUZ_E03896 [Eucalyptus grandis]|uniref:Uncharacterized protein n=2 Tax=Eucalyptus grandis TaxID=71139 RepID=A0A059CA75_EUCGR|nr:hypothetical protein EUGRSUZ_E03896 [Eucalyptus grandis]